MQPGWYHISSAYLGERPVLSPRLPRGPAVGEERETPRVSVCEDVESCLRAITGIKCPKLGFVYRLHGKARGVIDYDTPRRLVPDWESTGEAWLLQPNEFRFVCPISIAFDIFEDDAPSFERVRNPVVYVCPSCDTYLGSEHVGCGDCSGSEEHVTSVPVRFNEWAQRVTAKGLDATSRILSQ